MLIIDPSYTSDTNIPNRFRLHERPCCTPGHRSTSTWRFAPDGGHEGRKPTSSWTKLPGLPHNVWLSNVQAGCQRSIAVSAVEIWDRQQWWSGSAVHSDYAATMNKITAVSFKLLGLPHPPTEAVTLSSAFKFLYIHLYFTIEW